MSVLVWATLLCLAFVGFYLVGYGVGARAAACDCPGPDTPWWYECFEADCPFTVASSNPAFVARLADAHTAMHRLGE